MTRIVLHIGMPKTGTTSVQLHVAPRAGIAGWLPVTSENLGWSFVGLRPQADGKELVPYDDSARRWCNLGTMAHTMEMPVFVSAEQFSRAPLEKVRRLAAILAGDHRHVTVLITWVDLGLAIPRWVAERCAHQGIPFTPEEVNRWASTSWWAGMDPDVEGLPVRPDVVAARWRRCFPDVRCVDVSTKDTCVVVADTLGLVDYAPSPRENQRFVDRGSYELPSWLIEARREVNAAMASGAIAGNLPRPLRGLPPRRT